jgi:hypothetical protein
MKSSPHTKRNLNFLFAFTILIVMGFTNIGFADLSFKSQTYSFDLNENSANGTVIGQVSATGGDYAYTLQLDVGTQEISNWSTRSEDFETINFSTEFNDIPVVISQVQSDGNYNINCTKSNGSSWTADGYDYLFRTRKQNYTTLSFEAILETDLQVGGGSSISSIDSVEGSETVGWVAFSSSASGLWTEMPFEVALTDEIITESTTSISFTGPFTEYRFHVREKKGKKRGRL